ncbi:MAG: single-stranded DNA-binding protein [Eubacteriales bacterium]|nr:single-stranded DNA-binding protein [Eubacteriales bacterium]
MNKVVLMGRLTRNPDIRYTQGAEPMCIARYTLAVDRRGGKEGGQSADFIGCVAFGKTGEVAEKYLSKGTKLLISGRIQTGSYTNRDGVKVYTTDVVVESQEFVESRASAGAASEPAGGYGNDNMGAGREGDYSRHLSVTGDGFMNIPDGIDEELPFT